MKIVSSLFLLLGLVASCQSPQEKAKEENKFSWNAGISSPKYYPSVPYVEFIAETGAYFTINKSVINIEGKPAVFYSDSFDNLMSNNKQLKVIINGSEVIQFKEYRSQVHFSNNRSVTILPMKDIQEIANKTFYLDGQTCARFYKICYNRL